MYPTLFNNIKNLFIKQKINFLSVHGLDEQIEISGANYPRENDRGYKVFPEEFVFVILVYNQKLQL